MRDGWKEHLIKSVAAGCFVLSIGLLSMWSDGNYQLDLFFEILAASIGFSFLAFFGVYLVALVLSPALAIVGVFFAAIEFIGRKFGFYNKDR